MCPGLTSPGAKLDEAEKDSIIVSFLIISQTGPNCLLCYFTLSNARTILLVKGEPLGGKGLNLCIWVLYEYLARRTQDLK